MVRIKLLGQRIFEEIMELARQSTRGSQAAFFVIFLRGKVKGEDVLGQERGVGLKLLHLELQVNYKSRTNLILPPLLGCM